MKLTQKGNVIPVYKEINADLDTPVSAFLKIENSEYAFLLESVEEQENIGRYSFLGSNPALVFRSKGKSIQIIQPQKKKISRFITKTDPLDEIKKLMFEFKPVPIKGLPRFYGGLVGYFAYDMVRFFEEIPDKNEDALKLSDAVFLLTDTILVFDHINHTIKIVTNIILPKDKNGLSQGSKTKYYHEGLKKIEAIQKKLDTCLSEKKPQSAKTKEVKVSSNFTKQEFENMVKRAKVFIQKGDIIQMVPSQRFSLVTQKKPLDVYRNLRSLNPSPYMYILKLNDCAIVGSSPEMLVRCEDGVVETRPIAGTRPRGKTQQEDEKLAAELLRDKKERAEHIMLVDLGRNDLGRVCKSGTVKVSDFMSVEKYSHVMHLVTDVSGQLDEKYDSFDVLRACFPAGTVSGSPKIRAMEIIDELENLRRGPYAGCVGYFSFSGNMDTCITIRTVVMKDNVAYVQAGGGIVADSIPAKEYQETVNKAKALIESITK
ncbi:MAG: anthranilate synthase component I [Candidatus Omnitrophica bacterium]|nr:anthranilate synthase component I [Candidatus Omnitrophota bacterium]